MNGAFLERLGAGQVRLLPVHGWSHAEGLTDWKVPSPDFNESFKCYSNADDVLDPGVWCRNGGALAATMFPPADPQAGGFDELVEVSEAARGYTHKPWEPEI